MKAFEPLRRALERRIREAFIAPLLVGFDFGDLDAHIAAGDAYYADQDTNERAA